MEVEWQEEKEEEDQRQFLSECDTVDQPISQSRASGLAYLFAALGRVTISLISITTVLEDLADRRQQLFRRYLCATDP